MNFFHLLFLRTVTDADVVTIGKKVLTDLRIARAIISKENVRRVRLALRYRRFVAAAKVLSRATTRWQHGYRLVFVDSSGNVLAKGLPWLVFLPSSNEKPVRCCHLSNDFFTDRPLPSPFEETSSLSTDVCVSSPLKIPAFLLVRSSSYGFPLFDSFPFADHVVDGRRKYSSTMTLDSRGNAAVYRRIRRRISY